MIQRPQQGMFIFSLCEVTEIFSRFDFNKLLMCCKGGSLKDNVWILCLIADNSKKTLERIIIYFYNSGRERRIIMGIWVPFCETSLLQRIWVQGSLLCFDEFELLSLYCFTWLCGRCLSHRQNLTCNMQKH